MRMLGYRAVDEIVRHLTTLRDRPVGGPSDRRALERLFTAPPPENPSPAPEVLGEVVDQVLTAIVHTDHPRFMAYVPGPSNYVGAIADFLAAGFNVFAGHWLVGAGPAIVERVTVDWLRGLCGLPDGGGGLFVSGGTAANLAAVHAARTDRLGGPDPRGVIYVTAQTHASIRKGLRFLGLADRQVCAVPVDGRYRMDPDGLRASIRRDGDSGLRPFCVVATAGTTSTGASDPLPDVADVCREGGLWLHVDAAYGAAAVLAGKARQAMDGLSRADSIALDPHKWWFQPYEAGCVLVREAGTLARAYTLHAEYLRETRLSDGPLNYYDFGPQLTRSFRALKVWMSLRTFGLNAFRSAVEHGLALAEHAQATLNARKQWEIVTPAQLGIVTFRPHAPGLDPGQVDSLTRAIAARSLEDGYALVLTTELATRPVLRMCTIHPETTRDDVTAVIDRLEQLGPADGTWP
jgi:aromatic-L-amino-acid/L-tryptophan decarboxylase